MYRAILPNGQLECDRYEKNERGVEQFDAEGELLAFVPYENLEALLAEGAYGSREPSVM
jgi:hypothetical protein